jgi:iron complex outermembrane recepter protein
MAQSRPRYAGSQRFVHASSVSCPLRCSAAATRWLAAGSRVLLHAAIVCALHAAHAAAQAPDATPQPPDAGSAAPETAEPVPVIEDTTPVVESTEPEPVAEATPAAAEDPDATEMIVTGSRIKRSATLAASAPVEILDRKAIERTGASNVADLVQMLSAAPGSGFQGGGSPGSAGGGAYGASMINLRGLGAAATLVLVNGRRLVPSAGGGGAESFGDVGVIPLAAIERVEILKGGGSAIYGADAVGGVVNLITRSAWDGVRLELDGQGTTRVDHGEVTASGAFGAKTERSRVLLAVSYFRRSELRSDKRPFSQAANVDVNGNPGTFIAPGFDPMNPMRLRFPDPGCERAEGSSIRPIPGTADANCVFNYSKYFTLISGLERAHAFGSASFDLSKHVTLFAEAQVQRSRVNIFATPSYSIPPPLLVVPAEHVDNPFGRDVTFVGRPFGAAAGAQSTVIGDDTFRIVTGVRGDLPDVATIRDWEWELSASWGVSRYTSFVSDTLRQPLTAALNSCSDLSDLSRCFNPFFSAIDGTGTPNSQRVVDSIFGTATTVNEQTLQTYQLGTSASLFDLPGGPLGLALGAELRHERRQTQVDHDSSEQRYTFFLGSTDAVASRDVVSGYAELRWPFLVGLDLQTALRVEHYSDIARTTPSPFAGISFTAAKLIGEDRVPAFLRRLHVTTQVTSAFRAPTLYQANPSFSVVPTALNTGMGLPVFSPVQNFGNPNLKPERAWVLSAGLHWQPVDPLSLSLEFWRYDYRDRIALQPAQQVLNEDLISREAGGPGDARVVRDPATGDLVRVQLTQENIPGHVQTSGLDFGATITLTGANFGGSAQDFGAISFGAQGTLMFSYTIPRQQAASRRIPNTQPMQTLDPLGCDGDRCETVGARNFNNLAPPLPRMRMHIPLAWSFGGHMTSLVLHYLSGVDNDNDVQPDGSLSRLSALLTCDLQYGYTFRDVIAKELSLRIGLYNVFDTLPPATRDLNGFDTLLYDPRGRIVYAKLVGTY